MQDQMTDKIVAKLLDMDSYMRENMFTRSEAKEMEERLVTSMDRFAKLHETLDTELVALRGKYDRLEGRLEVVEAKLGLAGA